uniref:Uncharacterized protein n=1 Tax=Monopterus albus TaxID=43700 RepID=A0A3Q3J5G7_MONAL
FRYSSGVTAQSEIIYLNIIFLNYKTYFIIQIMFSFPADDVSDDIGLRAFLLCHIPHDNSTLFDRDAFQIKWTKVAVDGAEPEDVLTARGIDKETFGSFQNRVFLYTEEHNSTDASIIILNVTTEDTGEYRCEISGIDDVEQAVFLNVEDHLGVVFPYSPHLGRYNLNFEGAVRACAEQNAVVASYDQLFEAWKGGLDWCNAGWLNDGTVQYPITKPRDACGGSKTGPGLRNHGLLLLTTHFASLLSGEFYWLDQPHSLSYDEAVQACLDDDAEIAKVGHIYAAWKLRGYDRCDAGWLADGSVRYPISRPRKNCSPTEAAVRFVGFPDKNQVSYGVYCFKAEQVLY